MKFQYLLESNELSPIEITRYSQIINMGTGDKKGFAMPWDVICYVDLLCADPEASPKAFWINTSGNEIIRRFIRMARVSTRREIEQLINGETIIKKINQELTYRELYGRMDNLWSVLFMTGYLTSRGKRTESYTGWRYLIWK